MTKDFVELVRNSSVIRLQGFRKDFSLDLEKRKFIDDAIMAKLKGIRKIQILVDEYFYTSDSRRQKQILEIFENSIVYHLNKQERLKIKKLDDSNFKYKLLEIVNSSPLSSLESAMIKHSKIDLTA